MSQARPHRGFHAKRRERIRTRKEGCDELRYSKDGFVLGSLIGSNHLARLHSGSFGESRFPSSWGRVGEY